MRDEEDDEARVDLASRISARAIVSGTLVALAGLGLLLAMIGIYAQPFGVHAVEHLGFGTYLWAFLSWLAAICAGTFVAVRVGRARRPRDGALYGVVTWAAACVTGAVLLCTWYMAAVGVGIVTPAFGEALLRQDTFAGFFAADIVALAGAFLTGTLAARTEGRATGARGEPERVPVGGRPAPAA